MLDMNTTRILRDLGVDLGAPASSVPIGLLVEAIARRLSSQARPEPVWLTTREAARYLRVTPKTLRRWARESNVIVRRKGAGRAPDRYCVDTLDAFLDKRHPR